ncbi:hypothetical protein DY037_08070, partial [Apilactobacillus micheneri]|uniref:hypothetical protein n=1 Tax=Apilactobacillus micheneri TaxID=1899430 RepID=UPI0015E82DD2
KGTTAENILSKIDNSNVDQQQANFNDFKTALTDAKKAADTKAQNTSDINNLFGQYKTNGNKLDGAKNVLKGTTAENILSKIDNSNVDQQQAKFNDFKTALTDAKKAADTKAQNTSDINNLFGQYKTNGNKLDGAKNVLKGTTAENILSKIDNSNVDQQQANFNDFKTALTDAKKAADTKAQNTSDINNLFGQYKTNGNKLDGAKNVLKGTTAENILSKIDNSNVDQQQANFNDFKTALTDAK